MSGLYVLREVRVELRVEADRREVVWGEGRERAAALPRNRLEGRRDKRGEDQGTRSH